MVGVVRVVDAGLLLDAAPSWLERPPPRQSKRA
jgi:hypothetical protein